MTPDPDSTLEAMLAQGRALRAVARSILRDTDGAEDVIQEVYASALERGLQDKVGPGWLTRAVANLARRRLRDRARRRARETEARDEVAAAPPTDEVVAAVEMHRDIATAVLGLAEPYRRTVVMRFWHDLPPRVIARQMDVPVATVKTRLQRGLALLRERLDRTHGGRRQWLLAMVPIARPGPLAALATPSAASISAAVLAMNLKPVVAAVALVCVSLTCWSVWGPLGTAPQPVQHDVAGGVAAAVQPRGDATSPPSDAVSPSTELPSKREGLSPAATTGDWIVRGRVRKGPKEYHGGARIQARCFRGYDSEGELLREDQIVCDATGQFEWTIVRPSTSVLLWFEGAMRDHGGLPARVRVPKGEAPPQDVRLMVYPRDVTVTGSVTDAAGAPIAGAWVLADRGRELCAPDGNFQTLIGRVYTEVLVTAGAPGHLLDRRVLAGELEGGQRVDFRLGAAFRIEGRVVDPDRVPVVGAEVTVFPSLNEPALTDADGRFAVDGLDAGRREQYTLGARARGYLSASAALKPADREGAHELVLRRGTRLHGRVVSSRGEPVAGADLTLGPHAAVSEDDGTFAFPAVESGVPELATRRTGFAPDLRAVKIEAGVPAVEVVVELRSGHSLAGVVVDQNGAPIAGVSVSVRVPTPSSWEGDYIGVRAGTAANGSFHLESLPAGRVNLEFFATGFVRADLRDVEVDRTDVRLEMQRGARVAGRVVDAGTGTAVTAFRIRLSYLDGDPRTLRGTWRAGHAFRDAEGRWDSVNAEIAVGQRFRVEALAEGYAIAGAITTAAHEPDPEACVLRLHRGATIEGSVVRRRTGEKVESATVSWFVQLHDLADSSPDAVGVQRVRSDKDGLFALTRVPPGPAQLAVEVPGGLRHIDGPFDLAECGRTFRHIELPDGARIHGVVVDAQGKPGKAVVWWASPSRGGGRAEAGTDGRFEFTGLDAGEYRLFGYLRHGSACTPVLQVVKVMPEQDLEVRLAPGGSSTVRGVVSSEIEVRDGTWVLLVPTPDDMRSQRAWRGETSGGRFELCGVPAGAYRVFVTGAAGDGSSDVHVADGQTADVTVTVTPHRR